MSSDLSWSICPALSSEANVKHDEASEASNRRARGTETVLESRRVNFCTHIEERTEASSPSELKLIKTDAAMDTGLPCDHGKGYNVHCESGLPRFSDDAHEDSSCSSPLRKDTLAETLSETEHTHTFSHAMHVFVAAITPSSESPSNWLTSGGESTRNVTLLESRFS